MALRYARGFRAWGMCSRSGRKMLLLDMVRDPLTDLLVDPDWAEPPLMRPPTDITDGVALERPAPDLDRIDTLILFGSIFDLDSGNPFRPLVMQYECGAPLITTLGQGLFLTTEDGNTITTEDGVPIIIESDQFIVTEDGSVITTEGGDPLII
jgi:hypothetical protein